MSSCVQTAMENAKVAVDDRSLVPLDEARALVAQATEFRKGSGRFIDGSNVLDSDRLWAALLSLEDADEFVREARRLRWFFHPRGQEGCAPLERYGDGILPWLLDFVKDRLVNVPWCVVPCLLAIGHPQVFDALWKVRTVVDGIGTEWPGPFAADNPGDADKREGVNLTGPIPDEPDDSATRLVIDWINAHPGVGYGALAERAIEDDERARLILLMAALLSPHSTYDYVRQALGDEQADAVFEAIDAPKEFEPRCVLQGIYSFVQSANWPVFIGPEERAYHALNMIVAREKDSDIWGMVFERLEGSEPDTFRVHRYIYNCEAGSGQGEVFPEFGIDGDSIRGPAGTITFEESSDLLPDKVTAEGSSDFSVRVRAYLAQHPRAFFSDRADAVATLVFEGEAEVIVDVDSFEHILGKREPGPGDYDAEWRINPDKSEMMQSLARAVVRRDPSLFSPGDPNTDWRVHALFSPEN